MGDYIVVTLLGGAFLLALLVMLTARPQLSKMLTSAAGICALIIGVIVYGYGYLVSSDSFLLAVTRTAFAVCRMFIGEEDFSSVCDAPAYAHRVMELMFWAAHILAFYATSSAAISIIGAAALSRLRARFSRCREVSILYGVNADSVSFGHALLDRKEHPMVFVSEDAENSFTDSIAEFGALFQADRRAVSGAPGFLKSLGIRKDRKSVTVYAMDQDCWQNISYARKLLDALEHNGVPSSMVTLVIHAEESEHVKALQVSKDRYGYGFVTVFQEPQLAARLLTLKYPPCRYMNFREDATAAEDFEAVIIGFEAVGQEVLKSLVMNGQFPGSTFRADVFAQDYRETGGYFCHSFRGLLDHYAIRFHDHGGSSEELYAHLTQRMDHIKYIAVCTGNEEDNQRIEEELRAFFYRHGRKIPIHQCDRHGIKYSDPDAMELTIYPLYHPDVLDVTRLDAMAMVVNQHYMGAGSRGALEDWMDCDYFSRTSCRAYADFAPAVLRVLGKTEEQALAEPWEFSPELLEKLGILEHDRWCAFHFCMGFLPMSQEEYEERTRIYLQQRQETGKGSIRIGKNLVSRTHACLIPWEALDALSEKESGITGKAVDYKQMDIENILLLPELLQKAQRNHSPRR